MTRWEVRSKDRTVQVEAPNWLVALGLALETLSLEPEAMTRMVCDTREEGWLRVREPLTGTTLSLRKVVGTVARTAPRDAWDGQVEDIFALDSPLDESVGGKPKGAARFALADSAEEREHHALSSDALVPSDDEFFDGWDHASSDAPPPLSMPFPKVDQDDDVDPFFDDEREVSVSSRVPPSVQIALLERGLEIASARRPAEAADLALTVLRQMIPSDSGAVLIKGRGGLVFLAAQGPRSDVLLGLAIPSSQGLAGFVATRGESLLVNNITADIRHDPEWDARTGYKTKAILAVPLRDARDEVRGCLQLLNPPARFLAWHLEAAQSVAVALAEALRALGG